MASKSLLSPLRQRPGIRRLSSMTATANDVSSGGVIVVPERFALPEIEQTPFKVHVHKVMDVDSGTFGTPEYHDIRLTS